MTVKIGLISDVHATAAPLQEALTILQGEAVDKILCAGDIAGYGLDLEQTVDLLIDHQCLSILGNHDVWRLDDYNGECAGSAEAYLRTLPGVVKFTAAGKRLCMVHASPPQSLMDGIRLRNEQAALIQDQKDFWSTYLKPFPFDVLVVGHTHQVFAERLGDILVINPGSTRFNHTCAVLSLPGMSVQFFPLGGKSPVLAWNWSMARAGGEL